MELSGSSRISAWLPGSVGKNESIKEDHRGWNEIRGVDDEVTRSPRTLPTFNIQLTSSFLRRSATMFKAETRVLAAMGTPFELQSTMDGEEKNTKYDQIQIFGALVQSSRTLEHTLRRFIKQRVVERFV